MGDSQWLVCSSCRKPIGFSTKHWVCSVSTCNRGRTNLVFCSVSCWDAHLPYARHRESWAVEARSPTPAEWAASQAAAAEPAKPSVPAPGPRPAAPSSPPPSSSSPLLRPSPANRPAPVPDAVVIRRAVDESPPAAAAASTVALAPADESDVLVVVSKLKAYIRARSGMNTSDGVTEHLSDLLRKAADEAIQNAAAAGRKTVLDRDVQPVVSRFTRK